ncbi:T9SS type B sorting domain-containing protein [Flavobacterium hauense]
MDLNLHKPCINTVYSAIRKYAMVLLLLITAPSVYAQFTVNAVTTNETCDGNGSLALSVQNATAGASITYIVYYLGPTGASAPILVWNNALSNVPAQQNGVYQVEAHQYVNNIEVPPFATTQATIADNTVPLEFALTSKPVLCGNDGEITVTIVTGNAVSYKLTAANGTSIGPQPSPTFTGLTHNVLYTIVATNNCGEAIPHSLSIIEAVPTLQISPAIFPDVELIACDKLTIKNVIVSANGVPIPYPLQAKFTVTHVDGTVNIYNVPIPSGEPDIASTETVIDYHYGEPCHYKVEITNICNQTITSPELDINPLLTLFGETVNIKCSGINIVYKAFKFMGPFTLEFINPPPGFNPADYNDKYPGPYTVDDEEILFGDENTPLPLGIYKVKIHDQCNRTPDGISNEIEVKAPDIEINVSVDYHELCNSGGMVTASIPGLPIGVATMTMGPPEYSTTYGVDLDAFIQNKQSKERDEVKVGDLPPGDYFIVLKDTCGVTYPGKPFTIKPYNGDKGSYLSRPDCEVGFGSITTTGAILDHIEIINAPTAFSNEHPLPYDASPHIHPTEMVLYMDHLPPGQYKFKGNNGCDDDIEWLFNYAVVPSYSISEDEYILTPHCGAFDLFINHQSTGTSFVSFSLQKWDDVLGTWRHPDPAGTTYVEGDPIVSDLLTPIADRNGLKLTNNATNPNLIYSTGKYRVLKLYQSFGDGAKGQKTKLCSTTLYEFEYYSELTILGAISLDCQGNSGEVLINAFGVPPLNYSITAPFVADNGQNNTFTGLNSGIYTIQVKDNCNITRTLTFNVADIPSLVHVPAPSDLDGIAVCDLDGDNKETFDISVYTPLILDDQNPDDVTITYHTSENDANLGTNPITNLSAFTTGTTTIYARATHDLSFDCIAITWFNIVVNPMPKLNMKEKWGGCEGEDVTITADSGYDYYSWTNETGSITIVGPQSITVSDAGRYTVTVRDAIGCEGSKDIQVVKSPAPVINTVTIKDWTDKDNTLTVVMEPTPMPGSYLYSLDNIHFQSEPTFNGLAPGLYTVYVKDEFNCGDDKFETYILTYPKFFTPNGDGINEYWRIYMAILEPDMLVYIYDRYGKLITGFGVDSKGWDGTLNGSKLPATDYWFVVKRQNGQEMKGHFSMIR